MMDVAIAIDGESRNVVLRAAANTASYDDDGNYTGALAAPVTVRAAIFPATGDKLRDVPEGIRTEAGWLFWSRTAVKVDDRIQLGPITYRVLFVWDRELEGGFWRAALGRVTP